MSGWPDQETVGSSVKTLQQELYAERRRLWILQVIQSLVLGDSLPPPGPAEQFPLHKGEMGLSILLIAFEMAVIWNPKQ